MSLVSIYNLALIPLSVDRVLDPLEETEQARKCNEIYPILRDDELSGHPWNFAVVRVQCLLTTDVPVYEYSCSYQVPSDCLRILEVECEDTAYRREGDRIVTDESPLYIQYIQQVTDTNLFSPAFKSLIGARLKFELCTSLTGNKTMALELYSALQGERKRAKAIDAQEGTPGRLFSDRVVNARQGSVR
jgi:hypothetical protein